jgi:hypothetical protein
LSPPLRLFRHPISRNFAHNSLHADVQADSRVNLS